jgi:hypothetical protein
MKKFFPLLLLMGLSLTSFAQTKVSGKIFDDKKLPAEFVNLALFSSKDSSLVKAAISDLSGVYAFDQIQKGKYFVTASSVGFKKFSTPAFEVAEAPVQLENIVFEVESKELQTVTVTAQKPFLEQQNDKLIVNVASSPTAAGATAMEVLRKVPGLIVVQDKISIAGKASVNIMINGRMYWLICLPIPSRKLRSSKTLRLNMMLRVGR